MWIFTKLGFYSSVCARQGDGSYPQPVDRDRVMVRARVRKHLVDLQAHFPEQLGDTKIFESAHSDYRFRLFTSKSMWSIVLAGLASELDYDNFKAAVARDQGADGEAYEDALHEVWSNMLKLQS